MWTTRGNATHAEYFDGVGRPSAEVNSAGIRTETWHDACGRKTFESLPYAPAEGGGYGTFFSYDALGRVTRALNNTDNSEVRYNYSSSVADITDEEGRTTQQVWTAYGDPDDATLVSVREATGDSTNYTYDALGNLRRVDHPQGNARTWIYDSRNLLTSETHPESGTVTFAYEGGLLAHRTDAHGTTVYTHDANHRLTAIDKPGGTAHDVTIGYDHSDNRTLLQNSFVQSVFTYDNGNQLIRREDTLAGQSFTTELNYDANGNLNWIRYPSGRQVAQTFDNADRLASVTLDSTVLADLFSYHPSGAVASYRAGNQIVHQTTFDLRHRPVQITSEYVDITYGYDRVGNVTSVIDPRPGMSQTLTYDVLDRLKTVGGYGQNVFEYDKLGNRTSTTEPPATYTYEPSTNRVTSISGSDGMSFGYDGAGNTTSAGGLGFTYSPDNMMATSTSSSGTTTYWYDGDGVRKYKLLPDGTAYLYLNAAGLNTLSEYKLVGTTLTHERDYVYAGSRVLASARFSSTGGGPPTFTDDPLVAQQTVIKAVHVMELRTVIDQQRARFGLAAYGWHQHPLTAQSHVVSFAHIVDLRTALTEIYQAANLTPPTYTDPVLQAGVTVVKAVHISELRAAVLALY